ncbi:DUF1801 domain-containing protein [Cohnella terricola]|uniref:DUF1801 domain-containing protein n=1 Tax=Cohnella terricola TaxID=1289167 RepID=A0A559J8V3_9BACL|nr:DUF1801 domain-containing protein [Cohnella terricola]TVX96315.1 DUF1801 domain-containing protein [Cohnella terricola]
MANKRGDKLNGHEQVAEFMNKLEHPFKKEIEEVRTIILSANNQLTEYIKWNAPSFCLDNEDRITFNLRGNGYFQLIFHCGSKVRKYESNEPLFHDDTGLLEWLANDRATVKFRDINDVIEKQEKLIRLVNRWLEVTVERRFQ